MKKQLLIIAIALISFGATAQSNVMNNGDLMLNTGIGFGIQNYSFGLVSGFSPIISIHASGEKGMFPTGDVGIVTLGASLDVGFSGSPISNNLDFRTQILFRGAWHLSVLNNKEWDVYAGGGVGPRFYSEDNGTYDAAGVPERTNKVAVGFTGFLGGRWMFEENLGLFGEVGTGSISSVRVGVTFKM